MRARWLKLRVAGWRYPLFAYYAWRIRTGREGL